MPPAEAFSSIPAWRRMTCSTAPVSHARQKPIAPSVGFIPRGARFVAKRSARSTRRSIPFPEIAHLRVRRMGICNLRAPAQLRIRNPLLGSRASAGVDPDVALVGRLKGSACRTHFPAAYERGQDYTIRRGAGVHRHHRRSRFVHAAGVCDYSGGCGGPHRTIPPGDVGVHSEGLRMATGV